MGHVLTGHLPFGKDVRGKDMFVKTRMLRKVLFVCVALMGIGVICLNGSVASAKSPDSSTRIISPRAWQPYECHGAYVLSGNGYSANFCISYDDTSLAEKWYGTASVPFSQFLSINVLYQEKCGGGYWTIIGPTNGVNGSNSYSGAVGSGIASGSSLSCYTGHYRKAIITVSESGYTGNYSTVFEADF